MKYTLPLILLFAFLASCEIDDDDRGELLHETTCVLLRDGRNNLHNQRSHDECRNNRFISHAREYIRNAAGCQ